MFERNSGRGNAYTVHNPLIMFILV